MSPRMRRVGMAGQSSGKKELSVTVELLKDWFESFYRSKEVEGLRQRTLSEHRQLFGYFVRFLTQHYLDEPNKEFTLSTDVLRSYILHMKNEHPLFNGHPHLELKHGGKKGLSPVTINVRLRSLKCLLKFLYREEYLPTDLSTSIKLMKTEKDTIRAFSEEQVRALLAQPDKRTYVGFRDYALMLFLLDTGARSSETLSLTLDFDPLKALITISAKAAKNTHGRSIPLSRPMVKALQELILENKAAFPDAEHIFLSESGIPLTSSGLRQRLKIYQDKADIQGIRVSPHTFRHTMAKYYILNGGDVFSLQRILSHSTMDMVRRYIQLDLTDIEAQHQSFSPLKNVLGRSR